MYLVESSPALDAEVVMAQPEKKAQQDVDAITTVLLAADGSGSAVAGCAVQLPDHDSIHNQSRESLALPGRGIGRCEIGRAIDALNITATSVASIHRAARRKLPIGLQSLKQDIDALIDVFLRGPNELFWALTANRRIHYSSRRSVGCAVWALALGQRLDLDRTALHELMLGALLLDIGKLYVPVVIQVKAGGLNKSERNFSRRHVAESVRILESVEGLSAATLEMVHSHHERIDGSGYPFGLKGNDISLFAQIAGIVDSFDALSLNRYYAAGLSGHAAIGVLQKERGKKFDSALIDHFVSAIGELPTGTWVKFTDGCTGIVCSQDPVNLRASQVVLIADAEQQPFLAIRKLFLHDHSVVQVLPPAERPRHATAMERSLQAAIYCPPTVS
jgi:HD-GYP domain-containing protein (c-di-GMP phosphodiesterase class II)